MKNRLLFFMRHAAAAVLFFAGSCTSFYAQDVDPVVGGTCVPPPNCIINSDLNPNGPGAGGNVNSSAANTVPGWFISHGTPSLWGGAPPSPAYGIWMWSYSGGGEGIFSCYNFQQGHTYQVCFWVMNTNAVNAGNLRVIAANGLVPIAPSGFGGPPPTPASQQLISNTYINSPVWTLETYTFTPNANYTQLWIYPFMAAPPQGGSQYELVIDLVRVQETIPAGNITSTADTITWCESATLCASGSPSGTYTWSPSTGLNTTTGSCVIASPCSTTTYTVDYGINTTCPGCSPTTTSSYTLVVVPPDVTITSNSPVPCGEEITLSIDPNLACADMGIYWYDPSNNYIGSGTSVSIPNANAGMSGTYRVEIYYGGCSIIQYVTVDVVDCPCEFTADFNFRSRFCRPVTFTDASFGSAVPVAWFWDFGDGGTSNLQNPTHTYTGNAVYTVCLTVISRSGTETCCNKVCKKVSCAPLSDELGDSIIPERSGGLIEGNNLVRTPETNKVEITVVPNPATEQAFVTIKNMDKPVVSLMNLNGSIIAAARMQSDGRYLVDLTGLASGIYLVIAEDVMGRTTVKLVKN